MTMYLGVDYGRKHIGVAVADGPLARPLKTVEMDNHVYGDLARVAAENQVEYIVIGLPEGEMDKEVKEFGDKVSKISGIKVVYHPETLTTHDALQALRQTGASLTKKGNDHVYAACLILEDYLESLAHA